jgi:xylulokinase
MIGARAPLDDPETIRRGYVQGLIETDRRLFYVVGSIFKAGGAMEWLRSVVGRTAQSDLIAEASAIPAGSRGVVFLPHLANSPPPEPDPFARGAFVGLTVETTPAMLYRAVLEGLAMQSRMLLDGLTKLAGIGPARQIHLIGGVTRNRLFTSIKASVFGRSMVVIDEPETTALGAALLAGVAAGIFPTFGAAVEGLQVAETVVEPDATRGFYDELRTAVFQQIHGRLQPVHSSLDRLMTNSAGRPPG